MPITRSSGILLHVTSLPGPFGTGTFGYAARDFARRLGEAGIRYWQVLPLGPPEAGDSPYQCLSAFAGNPVLIDPVRLSETGLVTKAEADESRCGGDPECASFKEAGQQRERLLRLAFSRLTAQDRDRIRAFIDEQRDWVVDYAWFLTLRAHYGGQPWWLWPDEKLRRRDMDAMNAFAWQNAEEVFFHMFVQQEFYRQWQMLKTEANGFGVRIFGDMPIYVARDSADVWSHSDMFELDNNLDPKRVAGVPPDYFSEDGQLWGNPLYDWRALAADGYRWWMNRIAHALRWHDAVRIDHFRGFEAYWAVDALEKTAKNGTWNDGPGMELFRLVSEKFSGAEIVAEDLGILTDRTRAFLDETGYPGMRVMQFAFDGTTDNFHLPHQYPFNCVAYVGTHDNDTLAGWLDSAKKESVRFASAYCRQPEVLTPDGPGRTAVACRAWIQTLWSSTAVLAVATAQDLLALGTGRRMNLPGIAEGNWTFRLTDREMADIDFSWLSRLNGLYGRRS